MMLPKPELGGEEGSDAIDELWHDVHEGEQDEAHQQHERQNA